MEKLVSVIIPVFNAESYLDKCVQSVLDQTYTNVEIILLDDGSTDKTLQLCQQYKKQYNNVIVKSLPHGGVSKARNAGISLIHGEYFTFVDSDDWVEKTFIEKMVKSLESFEADVAVCGYIKYFNENKKSIVLTSEDDKCITGEQMIYSMIKPQGLFTALWNKMYSTSLVKEKDVVKHSFDEELTIGEDEVWLVELLTQVSKVSFVNQALYVWSQREGSITHTKSFESWKLSEISAKSKVKEIADKLDLSSEIRKLADTRLNASLIKYTRVTYFANEKDYFEQIIKYRKGKIKLKDYFILHDAPLKYQIKVLLCDICINFRIPATFLKKVY